MTRVAVIGAGGMGRLHAGNLAGMADVEICGVFDEVTAAGEALAATYGAKAYGGLSDLLDTEQPDAAYVCLPPSSHGPTELALVAANVPFFVEKPVSLDPAVATDVAAAVAEAGLLTCVGYHWRYLHATERAVEILASSRPLLATGWWLSTTPGVAWWRRRSASGGQVIEQTTHVIDLARCLLGEVVAVAADETALVIADRYADADVADVGTALVRFASGPLGIIANTCSLDHSAAAGLDIFADSVVLRIRSDSLVEERRGEVTTRREQGSPFGREDEAFIAAVRSGDASGVKSNYQDALATLRLTRQIADTAARTAGTRPGFAGGSRNGF